MCKLTESSALLGWPCRRVMRRLYAHPSPGSIEGMRWYFCLLLALCAWLALRAAAAQQAGGGNPAPDGTEFFEKKLRPVLVAHCYECHSTTHKKRGGLLLDSRAGFMKGGDSGPLIK